MRGRLWSREALTILGQFAKAPGEKLYGYAILKATKLGSDTVYAALNRFADDGLLTQEWERVDRRTSSRPPRRFYRITEDGLRALADIREAISETVAA